MYFLGVGKIIISVLGPCETHWSHYSGNSLSNLFLEDFLIITLECLKTRTCFLKKFFLSHRNFSNKENTQHFLDRKRDYSPLQKGFYKPYQKTTPPFFCELFFGRNIFQRKLNKTSHTIIDLGRKIISEEDD